MRFCLSSAPGRVWHQQTPPTIAIIAGNAHLLMSTHLTVRGQVHLTPRCRGRHSELPQVTQGHGGTRPKSRNQNQNPGPPCLEAALDFHIVKGCSCSGPGELETHDRPFSLVTRGLTRCSDAVAPGFLERLRRAWFGLDSDRVSDADLVLLGARGITLTRGSFPSFLQPRVRRHICGNVAFQSIRVQIQTKW